MTDEWQHEIGSMRNSALGIVLKLYGNSQLHDLTIDRFKDLHLSNGTFCSGPNLIKTQHRIFSDILKQIFNIEHSLTWNFASDSDQDAQAWMRVSREERCFRDVANMSSGKGFCAISNRIADVEAIDILWVSTVCSTISGK